MPDKKKVHDILSETDGRGNQRRPVAFIQHGNPEDGYLYEGICPWCGETTCYVKKDIDKTIGGAYRGLLAMQKIHWFSCTANTIVGPKDFVVEVTTTPLGTEKLPKLQ